MRTLYGPDGALLRNLMWLKEIGKLVHSHTVMGLLITSMEALTNLTLEGSL